MFWSGLAAGLSMSFSMIAEGLLMRYLPDETWRPLVAKLGYSLGFLIVILGRQQLLLKIRSPRFCPCCSSAPGRACATWAGCGASCWWPTY
ncbi:MAG: hypothetical protein WKG07_37690 [Hymenobacter sp.]